MGIKNAQLQRPQASIEEDPPPVILFWTFGSSSHAWAQGTHDWGMWFCTLLVIGAVAALIFLLITLVRWLTH